MHLDDWEAQEGDSDLYQAYATVLCSGEARQQLDADHRVAVGADYRVAAGAGELEFSWTRYRVGWLELLFQAMVDAAVGCGEAGLNLELS